MREPNSELDVVYFIGKYWDEIRENTNLEQIEFHDGKFDAIGVYKGTEVTIEIERKGSSFFQHGHEESGCDLVICWENNRSVESIGCFESRKWESYSENPDPAFEDVGIDVIQLKGLEVYESDNQ